MQLSRKAGWWDASFVLGDFSQNNKHCILLSTTRQSITLASFLQCRICTNRNSLFYCNKSAAEAWICLVLSHGSHHAFFSVQTNWNGGRMAERKSCIFTCKIIIIIIFYVNPLTVNPTKWSNTLPTNCLSVFNHFVGLALKGLKYRYDTVFSTFFSLVQNVMKKVI